MQIDQTEQQMMDQALRPDAAAIAAMAYSDNAAIADELLPRDAGLRLLDIGCGSGKFTRLMASRGMRAAGIDPKLEDIARARELAAQANLEIDFQTGSGERLPFPDESFDVVAFSNSLHHMKDNRMALAEAARVLKAGGWLYVMEPVAWGDYHEATKLVNDESAVRGAAYRALRAFAEADGLQTVAGRLYRVRRLFARYEDWAEEQMARGETRRRLFAERGAEIRAAFERNARNKTADGLSLDQIFRVDLLRKR